MVSRKFILKQLLIVAIALAACVGAMSDVLINYFKELSPNISLMNTEGKNPRLLNIEGLQYIHKYA